MTKLYSQRGIYHGLPLMKFFKHASGRLFLTGFCLLILSAGFSQVSGDYRSNVATMNWSIPGNWQKLVGTTWTTSTDYPGQNACTGCTIYILNGNTVTLNISPANSVGNIVIGGATAGTLTLGTFSLTNAGTLTVNANGNLNLSSGSLTVLGTTAISGTITDGSNTGISTFTGLVTKTTGSWTSTSSTTSGNLVFQSGITNTAGSFLAGGATLGTGATVTAITPMSFNGTFTGSGAVTIDGSGGITLAGSATISGNLSLLANSLLNFSSTSTLTVAAGGNLSIATGASLSLSSTGSISVAGLTTINGTFTDANDGGTDTFTGLVTNNGTFNTGAVTTAGNIRLNGGFTNSTGSTCSVSSLRLAGSITGTAAINIPGAVTTNGTVTVAGGTLSITGSTAAVFSSSLVISTGAVLVISTSGAFSVAGNTTNAGSITDNDNTAATTFTGLFTNSGVANFAALSTANIVFNGGLVNSGSSFNVPTATISTAYTGTDITATTPINFSTGVSFTGASTLAIAGAGGVTFSGNANILIPAALTMATGSSVTVSTTGNFTVTGTTTMSGSFTDNENSGITTFTGLLTKGNGVWNSTAVTTPANMIFTAGINQTGGSFTAGGASVSGDITLRSTPAMTFNSSLIIGGTGNITITGTGGVVLAGAGIDYTVPGNLTLTGLLTVSGTGNFTVTGTTAITGSGGFTDNNNAGISTFTGLVTHNSTGRWTTTAVTTAANLILPAGFINTRGTFSAGAATIGDNKTLTGTVNMSFVNGINILGNGDITIAGTATTGVTFGGTLINYAVRNITITGRLTTSTTGNLTVSGTTTISGTGNFLDNNNTGITTFTGLVTVGSSATFTSTGVGTTGRMLFGGGISQSNTAVGAFAAGALRTTATQTWSGTGNITTNGTLDVNTGTLTNNLTGILSVGGTLTGAGTTLIQGTNARLTLNSTTPLSITTFTSTATGNTVTYGAAGNATMRAQTYFNLTVAGSGNKTLPSADITVNGSLTIAAGTLSNITNNRNITLGGNWINNAGTTGFAAGTGLVTFNGTTAQTLGGSFATTFANLTLNNAAGITQSAGCTVTAVLTLTAGKITTGANVVSISNTGTVVRTSGYIIGNEQMNIATGASVARTFDIGDATAYLPVTATFTSVSLAGDITLKTTSGDHPLMASSVLNSSLSINRYWTITNTTTTFSSYAAIVNFLAGDKDASANTANLIAGLYGSSWTYPVVGTKTATSTQVTGLTSFGDIALAEQLPCSTPTLVITNPAGICSPATGNITAAAVTAGSTPGLTYTFWTNAAATISLTTPAAVPAGTYYIKGTVSPGGCANVKPVVVSRGNPTGLITGTANICTGQSTGFNIAVTGTGPWSGTLSDGTTFGGSTSPLTATVTPVTNTTYTIATLIDANACSAQSGDKTGSAAVTLSPLPTTANAGPDQSTCGVSVTLAANTATVGTGSWSIVSGAGGAFTNSAASNSDFTGTAGTAYTLRWSISNSVCTPSTDDVVITFTAGQWIGTTDNDWYNDNNWCSGVTPTTTIDLVLPAGLAFYPTIDDNLIINNLSIAPGASIAVNGSLTVTGTFDNKGTLNNAGTIVLNGETTQTFPGLSSTITTMNNLEVDNDAGVIIDKSFGITGTLTSTNGDIDLVDKTITIRATASGTASVAPVGGSFSYSAGGQFIVQRYSPAKRAWRLLTAPLTSSTSFYDAWQNSGVYAPGAGTLVTGASGGSGMDAVGSSSLKVFDITAQALVPVTNTNTSISEGVSGSADNTGYFIFIRGDRNAANLSTSNANATVLSAAGQLQTGTQTFSAASSAGKYTLIGNPYASAIDFNSVTRTNLIKRFYTWDPNLNTVGGYLTLDDLDGDGIFTRSVAASTQTKIIASQQAFFVETAANGAASLTVDENSKVDGTSMVGARPAGFSEYLGADLYLLNADNTTELADGVRAEFNEAYSNGVNGQDAMKFGNVNENLALARSGSVLSIERRMPVTAGDTLLLKLTKATRRSYQFRFTTGNMQNNGLIAELKDDYLGTSSPVDLNGSTTVSFVVNTDPASAAANRFKIVFKPFVVLPVDFTSIKAYQKEKTNAVEWAVSAETNITKYEVERSADGSNYRRINTTQATATSSSHYRYSIQDEVPLTGNNFYRVKSIGVNGDARYSQVVKVVIGNKGKQVTIFPNPIENNTVNLQFSNQPAGIYKVNVLASGSGQAVYTGEITISSSITTQALTMPKKLVKGSYNVTINGPEGYRTQQLVIVQ